MTKYGFSSVGYGNFWDKVSFVNPLDIVRCRGATVGTTLCRVYGNGVSF